MNTPIFSTGGNGKAPNKVEINRLTEGTVYLKRYVLIIEKYAVHRFQSCTFPSLCPFKTLRIKKISVDLLHIYVAPNLLY